MGFALFFFILMFMHIYFTNAFFSQLKKQHSEVWLKLGEPRWKIHFGDDSFKHAMKYIRQKKFADLQDNLLEEYYEKIKRVEYSAVALALVILSATIVDVIQG
jgi:hypothetical protein